MTLVAKTAVLDRPEGEFTIWEAPVPQPGEGQMVVRQELCGVCGTDAHVYHGHLPGISYPVTLGHEAVGIVERLGKGVTEDYTGRPLREGDRVIVYGGVIDGRCFFCSVVMEPSLCDAGLGGHGLGLPGAALEFQAGYAQYIFLSHPPFAVLKIDVAPEAAIFFDPLGCGIHAVRRVGIFPVGSTVVIQGAGAIGIACLVAAKEHGAHRIIVTGAPQSRLDLAKEFGANVTMNIEEMRDPAERVRLVQGETFGSYGADIVVECTGVAAAIAEGIDMLRRGGSYVVAGHYTDVSDTPMNPYRHFGHKQIALYGSWGYHVGEAVRARTIVESGKYDFAALVTHKVPLDRIRDAMVALSGEYRLDGREVGKIAVDAWL